MNYKIILNFVLFQISWFACVIGAAKQTPWLGVAVVLACITWHLANAKNARAELVLMLISLVIGGLFDQIMQSTGLINYASHGWSTSLVPVWILALWLAFTSTLNMSLRWMRGKNLVAVFFGLIGGPLAYIGAEKLGAVSLSNYPMHYVALGLGWGIITPLLLKISQHFDGFKA
ncbi:MAG: DUF2878 domain-containing protein [Methylophilaceae bacterium]